MDKMIDDLDIMSMDDFEKAHPYTPPPAKMTTLTPSSDGAYKDRFHMECQAKGLTPYFAYAEPQQGCFVATVAINDEPLDKVGPYASKKLAKEAACKAAFAKLDVFPNIKEPTKREVKRAEAPPIPRVLENNTGVFASKLNMLCQQKGLACTFEYAEPSKGCFSGVLLVDGEIMAGEGVFGSKKDVKEELCRISYPKLLDFESRKKRKSLDREELPDAPDMLHQENWIGKLMEHCQGRRIGNPVFTETGIHPSRGPFSCAVHFYGSPPSGFGSTAGPFKKKADAKRNAAMEAVLWLRHEDSLG